MTIRYFPPNPQFSAEKPVAIFGAGGHGRVVGDILNEWGHHIYRWIFLDDDVEAVNRAGQQYVGGSDKLCDAKFLAEYNIIIGVGDCTTRLELGLLVTHRGGNLIVVTHPTASISTRASIGPGSTVGANAIIGVDTFIGRSCIVNDGAAIAHDCVLHDGAQVANGATLGGRVIVGEAALVGLGAVVLPKIRIGANAVVGAGTVVTKDVFAGVTVKGNPAR